MRWKIHTPWIFGVLIPILHWEIQDPFIYPIIHPKSHFGPYRNSWKLKVAVTFFWLPRPPIFFAYFYLGQWCLTVPKISHCESKLYFSRWSWTHSLQFSSKNTKSEIKAKNQKKIRKCLNTTNTCTFVIEKVRKKPENLLVSLFSDFDFFKNRNIFNNPQPT